MNLIEKLRGKRRWKWAGYSLFFSVAFYGAMALTFPYDALRDRVTDVLRDQTGKPITIGKIRLAGLTGISLYDVRLAGEEDSTGTAARIAELAQREEEEAKLRQEKEGGAAGGAMAEERAKLEELEKKLAEMPKDGEDRKRLEREVAGLRRRMEGPRRGKRGAIDEKGKAEAEEKAKAEAESKAIAEARPEAPAAPTGIHLDSVTAKLDLFAALRGRQGITFDARAWGGKIQGRVSMAEGSRQIDVRASDISLGDSPIHALSGLDLQGTLRSFELELAAEGTDFSNAEGKLVIKGDDLVLRGGEVQHFELPLVALGTLEGKVDVKEGKADTDTFEIRGPDLDAKLAATIRLAPELAASTLSGKLQLKPSDDWWNRNEMLKTAANFALPAQSDGWRALNLYGQLRRPGFRP